MKISSAAPVVSHLISCRTGVRHSVSEDGGEFKTERRGYTHNCVMAYSACSSLSKDGGEQDRRYTHNCVMVYLACSSLSKDGGEQDRRYTHK